MTLTVADCTHQGSPIDTADWPKFTSEALAAIVGQQQPGEALEDASGYTWAFEILPTSALVRATQHGEEPAGGWPAAYQRLLAQDGTAVAAGSTEYGGRDDWIRNAWTHETSIYPLFLVKEGGEYRLWDGHRRLAGAFFYGLDRVCALVGTPRPN